MFQWVRVMWPVIAKQPALTNLFLIILSRDLVGYYQADHPIIYFEATGIYSNPVEHFCISHNLKYCRLNPLELHLKSENLRRVKTDRQDARKIALTVQDNLFRLTVPKSPRFTRLHELSRFYNQLNNDWDHRLVQLHIALEQTFPELKQLFKIKLLN